MSLAHNQEYSTTKKNAHIRIVTHTLKKLLDFLDKIHIKDSSIKRKENVKGIPHVRWNWSTDDGNERAAEFISNFLFYTDFIIIPLRTINISSVVITNAFIYNVISYTFLCGNYTTNLPSW